MTREEFDRFVARIEAQLGRRTRVLERRVIWLALAVYLTLLATVLGLLGLAAILAWSGWRSDWPHGVFLWLGAVLVLGGGGSSLLRLVWVRSTLPQGRELTAKEAPALFSLLEELRGRLQAPSFDRVLLDDRCNASVVQQPRLGIFGWHRYLLVLGLPLLEGLSPDEARAVLAHELAHLSRRHGRTGRWIYYLRRSWENAFEQLSKTRGHRQAPLQSRILELVNWFWPRFNAHAFVLSRTNEYEADAVSVRLTSAPQMGAALVRQDMLDRHLEQKFWPELWETANSQPSPPTDVLSRLRLALRQGPSDVERSRWAEQAFLSATTTADTHPCLRERMAALGAPAVFTAADATALATAPPNSAADALLGEALPRIRASLERDWVAQHETFWRERHAKAGVLKRQLTRIDQVASASADTATVDSLWDKTQVLLHLQNEKDAEPLLRRILELAPEHAGANFALGRILLSDGQRQGERHLERAMATDPACVPAACELLHYYFRQTGQIERIRQLGIRLDCHELNAEASRAERISVSAKDTLLPHGLDSSGLEVLRSVFSREPEVERAFLVQKQLRHISKQRFFLLCVHARREQQRLPEREADACLVQRLSAALELPGRLLVITPSGGFRAIARRVAAQPKAQIFDSQGLGCPRPPGRAP